MRVKGDVENDIVGIANLHAKDLVRREVRRVIADAVRPRQRGVQRLRRNEHILKEQVRAAADLLRHRAVAPAHRRVGSLRPVRIERAVIDHPCAVAAIDRSPPGEVARLKSAILQNLSDTGTPLQFHRHRNVRRAIYRFGIGHQRWRLVVDHEHGASTRRKAIRRGANANRLRAIHHLVIHHGQVEALLQFAGGYLNSRGHDHLRSVTGIQANNEIGQQRAGKPDDSAVGQHTVALAHRQRQQHAHARLVVVVHQNGIAAIDPVVHVRRDLHALRPVDALVVHRHEIKLSR